MGIVCASAKKSFDVHTVPCGMDILKNNENYNELTKYYKTSYVNSNYYNQKPGNPGFWDDLHKKVYDLYPNNFDGLKIVKHQKLSEHFTTVHSFIMSGTTPTGYRFGAHFDGTKKVGPNERYPSIGGVIMTNGNLSTSFMHTLGCRFRIKVMSQSEQDEYKDVKCGLDYRTDDFTVSTKFANIDPFKCYGLFSLQYLQAVSPRIAIGAEMSCWRHPNYPIGNQTNMSSALRYSNGQKTFSAIVGGDGLHFTYHHIASQELQLGVAIKADLRSHKSEAAIVYRYDLPQLDSVFQGIVKSDMSLGAVIEKKLLPIPGAALLLSAFLDHKSQNLLVGIGLNIE